MKADDVLVAVAFIAVIVSLVGFGFTYSSVMSFRKIMTGFATETGTINLTVQTTASVNFTIDNVNFGAGAVDAGETFAVITTHPAADTETNCSQNNCSANPWDMPDNFVIENIGTVNVSSNVSFSKDAAGLLGASSTNPEFQFAMAENETGSCPGTLSATSWTDATTSQQAVCDNFGFLDSKDTLNMSIRIKIPMDSEKGNLSAIVNFNYGAVP